MRTSPQGVANIQQYEKLELNAYRDATGTWTIGYGHTASAGQPYPQPGMTVTADSALRLLMADIATVAEAPINKMVDVPLNQNQFDALASLVFNIGSGNFHSSTLLQKLNGGDYEGAAKEFMRWNRSKGQVLPGLTTRRSKEYALFVKPVDAQPAAQPAQPAQQASDPFSDIAGGIGGALSEIFTGGSAAPVNVPQAPQSDQGADMFNLTTLTTILSIVHQYGPKAINVVKNFPDIEKTTLDMIAKVKKLDIQGVQIDFQRLLSDFGLDESVITQSLTAAQVLPPDAPAAKVKS